MKNRGFGLIELVIVMAVGAAVLAAIAGIVYEVRSYTEGIRKSADKAGYDRALKEVAQRDKLELEDAQAQIAGLTLARDTAAALHAEEQARLKRIHDKEVADEKVKTADLQRRIASGELVLRDPGARAGPGGGQCGDPGRGGGGSETETATAPADGSGQTLGKGVSKPFAGFLVREADRADEVAEDLELCWGIARDDRAKMGTAPPAP